MTRKAKAADLFSGVCVSRADDRKSAGHGGAALSVKCCPPEIESCDVSSRVSEGRKEGKRRRRKKKS